MSRSASRNGLPAWLFQPRMAAMTGMIFAVVALFSMGIVASLASWWADFNQASESCFQINASPHPPGRGDFDASQSDAVSAEASRVVVVEEALAAEAACPLGNCSGKAQAGYQKSIKRYISGRVGELTKLDVRYGDAGLDWGQRLYDQLDDRQLVRGLRQRHEAGLVDVDAMQRYAPAARMLLYRPASEFRPCRQ